MPKGIPNKKTSDDAPLPTRRITIELNQADYDALALLAQEQYRTPQLQAGYLIMRVLADSGHGPSIEQRRQKLAGQIGKLNARANNEDQ